MTFNFILIDSVTAIKLVIIICIIAILLLLIEQKENGVKL